MEGKEFYGLERQAARVRQSAFPPDFLILGAQKCGTTSMADALRAHPDIFLPRFKEAKHFGFVDDDEIGGPRYQRFFSEWAGEPLVGEATPEYLFNAPSAEQICRYLPDVRAIIQIRNPVDRAYSAYWHGIRGGWVEGTFAEVIDSELGGARWGSYHQKPAGGLDLVERGEYSEQIRRYIEYGFERERMLVLPLDEVVIDPVRALASVQEFLGVEPVITEFPEVNKSARNRLPRRLRKVLSDHWRTRAVNAIFTVTNRDFTPPSMDPDLRARLVDHFRPWNERLSELLGRDFSHWDR